jgi:uncharacterized Zn-binding protein involved in type VI secretion
MHTCPMVTGLVPHVGGPIIPPCCPTVITCGQPQARVTDMLICTGPTDVIVKGSTSVIVCGQQAARIGDLTAHGGVIVTGCPTVIIGDLAIAGGDGSGAISSASALAPAGSQHDTLVSAAGSGAPFVGRCAEAAAAHGRNG